MSFTLNDSDLDAPHLWNLIGDLFWKRYNERYNIANLDKAISNYENSIRLTPDLDSELVTRLVYLGVALYNRFGRTKELPDIDRACLCFERSLLIEPAGVQACLTMGNLGAALILRFERLGSMVSIQRGIDVLRHAVELTPDGHMNKPAYLSNLGKALRSRFERLNNVFDLENAIDSMERAVELTPEGHTNKPDYLCNFGNALRLRFERLGNVPDLSSAIGALRKAAELTLDGHAEKPGCLSNLGTALKYRFERLGNISDLESAIDTLRMAVELTPDEHTSKPNMLHGFCGALRLRYERFEDVSDLEVCMVAQLKAVRLTPDAHANKSDLLNGLGIYLRLRFERLGNGSDLKACIAALQKAVGLTSDVHTSKPILLNSLGIALQSQSQFEYLDDISDLETAIDAQQKAVELRFDGDASKPGRLANLGVSLRLHFERLGNVSDLEASVDAQQKAVELTPDEHADKSKWLCNLGKVLLLRNIHLGDDSSLQEVLKATSTSAQSAFGELVNEEHQAPRAFTCAMSLIPQVAWMGLATEGRHQALAKLGDLVTKAAAAAVRYEQPNLALEWLEQGRSVVWGQPAQLRSPVDILRRRDPMRAQRLNEISQAIEANARDQTSSGEERGRQLRALSLEWDDILSQVRELDGFQDFLGPKKVEQLFAAASVCPIVVLNAHETGCDALVLIEGVDEVIHIPLQFTSERAHVLLDSLQMAQSGRSLVQYTDPSDRHIQLTRAVKRGQDERIESLLAELWNMVVKPVLDSLAFSIPESAEEEVPRICWCPTGSLSFLPIHAAGLYNTEQRGTKVFDYVVSSYTPTFTALLQSLQSPASGSITPRILAISQAQYSAQQVSALPETKLEISLISSQAEANSIDICVAKDADGSVDYVLEQMTKYSWIHLACHGVQDLQSPTKSAFILADRNLELEEIVKLNLPDAEFAFLSACQTATGDAKLAEEAVHLAAGMLLAGYKSVIAKMWSIRDKDGPLVAAAVYSEILKDGKADASRAAHALHKAVQQLRASGAGFPSWIPFIHMGK